MRIGVDEEVCVFVEFRHYNPRADTRNGKKISKDHCGLGFKGENLGNNVLIEETQKGKDRHHGRKESFPALRFYYCRKRGHIKKE